jgi:hypothetical protein
MVVDRHVPAGQDRLPPEFRYDGISESKDVGPETDGSRFPGCHLICGPPCPGGVGVSGVVSDRATGATQAKYELTPVYVPSYSISAGGE